MSQPLDRLARVPALGDLDREGGEFWVENPFLLPRYAENLSAFERNRTYLNVDGQSFVDASFATAADIDSDSRSVVAADFDGDEAPDLLIGSVGGGPLRLFLNRFPRVRRTRLRLIGVESNRAAIGARVVAQVGSRQLVRDLFPANGFMGQGPPEMILGLGQSQRITHLSVRWPSGKKQEFHDLPAAREIILTEGQSAFQIGRP